MKPIELACNSLHYIDRSISLAAYNFYGTGLQGLALYELFINNVVFPGRM